MSEPVLLDRSEAAERLRVSVRTVRRWGKAGRLKDVRIGPRLVRVTEQSVEAVIRAGQHADVTTPQRLPLLRWDRLPGLNAGYLAAGARRSACPQTRVVAGPADQFGPDARRAGGGRPADPLAFPARSG
jgi:excisionase family DNA binding protein